MLASKTRKRFSKWRLFSKLWSELDQIPKPCLYNLLQTYDQQLVQPTPASHDYTKLAYENCDEKAKEQDAKTGSNPICFSPQSHSKFIYKYLAPSHVQGAGFWRERLAKREKRKLWNLHKNPDFSYTKTNLCSSLWTKEHNHSSISLADLEHPKAATQNSKHAPGRSFWLCLFFILNIINM